MMEIIAQILLIWIIAEVGSGLIHWIEDRYGDPKWENSSSFFKRNMYNLVIGPNILHHKRPAAMTEGNYWQRNNSSIIPSFILAGLAYYFWPEIWGIWGGFLLMSQANEIHSWSHLPKTKISAPIKFLQKLGLIQSPKHHKIHHTVPYNRHYCVMTDFLNPILYFCGFWLFLEFIIWIIFGVKPVKEREIY